MNAPQYIYFYHKGGCGLSSSLSQPALDWRVALMPSLFILDHNSTLHDKLGSFERGDVFQGIAGHRDDICQLANLESADAILPAQQFRRVDGGCMNDLHGCHSFLSIGFKHQEAGLSAIFVRHAQIHVRACGYRHTELTSALQAIAIPDHIQLDPFLSFPELLRVWLSRTKHHFEIFLLGA